MKNAKAHVVKLIRVDASWIPAEYWVWLQFKLHMAPPGDFQVEPKVSCNDKHLLGMQESKTCALALLLA